MRESFDLIVVGAGMVGAAFALDVAQRSDLKVALVERSSPLEIDLDNPNSAQANQRVVALGARSVSLLDRVGVFSNLRPSQAHEYQSMMIWDENSYGELTFNAGEFGEAKLGHMVDALACTKLLQNRAIAFSSPNVRNSDAAKGGNQLICFFNTNCNDLIIDDSGAQLDCGSARLRAPLVVAADGARSWVRQQVGIFSNRFEYNQLGIVAKIKTSKLHDDCAWQKFLSTGPIAVLPLDDNYSSIVWSASRDYANDLIALSDGDFQALLGQSLDWKLGEVTELGPRLAFPLISQKAQEYVAPNVALIGDAAHSIHPLAGQGANLGFKDAQCLSDMLCAARPKDYGSVSFLSRYQRRRQPDNEQTDWLMSALHRTYQSTDPYLARLRGTGMNWLNKSGAIKAVLAEQAMGI